MISTKKNAASAVTDTALRIHASKERKMHGNRTTEPGGVIEACENLIATATDPYRIPRHGLIFEKSGWSMAVYDGSLRIDRRDLQDGAYQTFLESIDAWELDRYLGVA